MPAAFVKSAGNVNLDGTSVQATFGSAVSAGSLLVAFVYWTEATGTVSISDSVNGSWSAAIRTQALPAGVRRIVGFAFENTGAGTPTVTATVTGGPGTNLIAVVVAEFSGVKTSGALSQQNSANGTSATADSGSVTPASGFELFVGGVVPNDGAQTITAGADYSNLVGDAAAGSMRVALESRRHNGADSADFALTGSQEWAAMVLTFGEPAVATTLSMGGLITIPRRVAV